jgi:hypothetical protein
LAGTAERLIDFGRGLIILVMLDELHINGLIRSNAHEVERSTTLSDHLKISSILGIIEATEWTIFNAETILPKM